MHDVADDGRDGEPQELDGLPRVAPHRQDRDGVDRQRGAHDPDERRRQPEHVDHAVPGVADDGVDEHDGDGAVRALGGELGDQAPAHGVTGEDALLDAEVVDDATQQLAVGLEVGAVGGKTTSAAVAGGVDGDDLEPHRDQPRERLRVEEPLDGEPVHDDERDAGTGDGDAHGVAVGDLDAMAGQAGRGDGHAVAGDAFGDRAGIRFDDMAHDELPSTPRPGTG